MTYFPHCHRNPGFHDLVVGSGSMPLGVLEQRVSDWIAARR